jgi:hypothetical protein
VRWTFLRNDGLVYVTVGERTLSTAVGRHSLTAAG